MSEPDVLLHLVTPIGQGHHRDVAVTATIQIMHVSGKGVAAIVMGFEQVDPQLWSLRVGPNAELQHDQQTLPSMSSVSYEDEVNMCPCHECRSDASSICSKMRRKLMSSNMSESDRSSTVVTGQDEHDIPLLAQLFVAELKHSRSLGLAPDLSNDSHNPPTYEDRDLMDEITDESCSPSSGDYESSGDYGNLSTLDRTLIPAPDLSNDSHNPPTYEDRDLMDENTDESCSPSSGDYESSGDYGNLSTLDRNPDTCRLTCPGIPVGICA
eukprot:FR741913.1.p1 GENE.FR741913.1~~FR741913.1.p1  ORF type:complete len:311 (+),score=5.68 FR741913.1:131-934(+)